MKDSFRREARVLPKTHEGGKGDGLGREPLGSDPRLGRSESAAGMLQSARWQVDPWSSAPWDDDPREGFERSDAFEPDSEPLEDEGPDFESLTEREQQDMMVSFFREVLQTVTPQLAPAPPAWQAGRNDPCPCGSGKKFKRCHGQDSSP